MSSRILFHPILGELKRKVVRIYFEGQVVDAYEGDSVAGALWASGIKTLGFSRKYHEPRGVFCARGLCTSCIMRVDGIENTRTCIIYVKDGMIVERTNH